MVPSKQNHSRNTLIRTLGAEEYAAIARHLRRVELHEGDRLATNDKVIDALWFPESAVVSCTDVFGLGSRVEIGMVGYEGMIGWPLLLETQTSAHDVIVQVGGGTALRVDARPFLEICHASPSVAVLFRRYINAFTVQIGRTAVSNLRDPVERRLSRWLLMCHDRLDGDEIDLTHKTIATTLGVRRASITDSLHNLEGERMISNRRGRIVISDRNKLQLLAGDGYGHAEAHYSRTIAPFGKSGPSVHEVERVHKPDPLLMELIPAGFA